MSHTQQESLGGDPHAAFRTLTRGFRARPTSIALGFGPPANQRTLTYRELKRLADRHAAALVGLKLERGTRIAVFAGPCLESTAVLLAHYIAGLIHVPINTRYRETEVAHILTDSDAAAVVTDGAGLAVLDEVARLHPELAALPRIQLDVAAPVAARDYRFSDLLVDNESSNKPGDGAESDGDVESDDDVPANAHRDDDIALMIYTSGTTGRSKGVALSMRAVVGAISALTELWTWSERDRLVLALPLFHVHGLGIGIHGGLLHGMRIDLLPRFDATAVTAAIARGGTIFMGVPTMYRMLLEHLRAHPDAAATLAQARLFTAGSAALASADFHEFERLTGHRILERYGMSETLLTLSNPGDGERRPGSVGLPVPGFEIRVVDEEGRDCEPGNPGELWVRGVGVMRSYWNQPEATQSAFRDGWFMTGDVVARDPDGYVRILGRRSVDIIKSGGFKISAREIEEILLTHPQVAEIAIIGLRDPRWGQRIAAAVVPVDSALLEAISAGDAGNAGNADNAGDAGNAGNAGDAGNAGEVLLTELSAYAAEKLADYKKPRSLVILDKLPRNALGKIQKARLIKAIEAGEQTLITL